MGRDLKGRIGEVSVVALLVALNCWFAMDVVGLQYGRFSWEAFAQAYPPAGPVTGAPAMSWFSVATVAFLLLMLGTLTLYRNRSRP